MKKILPLLLACALAAPAGVFAKGKNAPKKEYVPIHTTITSVSDTSITIGTNDPKHPQSKTYTVTKDTVVELKGVKSTIKDLQTGMRVSVSVGRTADEAERISAGDIPKDPPKHDKKK